MAITIRDEPIHPRPEGTIGAMGYFNANEIIGPVQVTLPGGEPRTVKDLAEAARVLNRATQEAIRAADLRDQRRQISLEPREVTDETRQVNVGNGAIKPEGVLTGRESRPTLAEARRQIRRQMIIRNIRQSWASGDTDRFIGNVDPMLEQARPDQEQNPPSFDRPRRLISLENE